MDIKVPHSWLKEHLETRATPQKIGECLALSGPSFERINQVDGDFVYDIEITTNRIDCASVRGIAREAVAILPQFGVSAKLKPFDPKIPKLSAKNLHTLNIKTDPILNKRVMAVVIDGVDAKIKSPLWMKERLEKSNVRSLNLLVDITNYVMLEVGHPTHVFDFDKVPNQILKFRLSKKGEHITSLDNKKFILSGGDIIIENSKGEIMDLPGIIGTKNSVVDNDTKRIIFFLDNNDPLLMRKTSLALGIRTMAVQLNEKSVDPELAEVAFKRGIELYVQLAKGQLASKIYDIYNHKTKTKKITVSQLFINKRLGIDLTTTKIKSILESLEFKVTLKNDNLEITVPSFRQNDVFVPEDIVEEVARIYGYHNIPSVLMQGQLPTDQNSDQFDFEQKIRNILKGFGGSEFYSISLVSKEEAGESAVRIKNPLGADTEYLRTTLLYTTLKALKKNSGTKEPLHLFEMAHVYVKNNKELPAEKLMLSGGFASFSYRNAKGIMEGLLDILHINATFDQKEKTCFFVVDSEKIGLIQKIDHYYCYEFEVEKLIKYAQKYVAYKAIPLYPAQIEDITLKLPKEIHTGKLLELIKKSDILIRNAELVDIFERNYTFRIWYQHQNKTLTGKEVEKIRNTLIKRLVAKFSVEVVV